eukprot:CAMPEP_0206480044 /NCGR_PEP_ID=MMETSP0324_2-20121206/37019_1 /ASSEMBLY_ACC=CAM_ASM_000836 /TAXON_ID=2866 /ORGANISM="Crypthecodinium cohnii, Strain Seligo" /LENGTH=461 /DNA_ID=CAMNT_0053956675 /DNA_START=71 /DNA_END=1453 /DNA_ORIENTATION=+
MKTASQAKFDQIRQDLSHNLSTLASDAVLRDWEVMKLALSIPELHKDQAVALRVLEVWPGGWKYVDKEIFREQDTMLKVIKMHGRWLKYASPEMRGDKEVVLMAVASDAWALEFASDALKADKEVVLRAVTNHRPFLEENGEGEGVLCFASAELKCDKEVVLAAVASDAWDLEYASEALKGDRDVVLAALKRQSRDDIIATGFENVLAEVSPDLQADPEIVLEAVRVDGPALRFASSDLRGDLDFVLQAMRMAPVGELEECYSLGADPGLLEKINYHDVVGAAKSALALAGESAPVLSVSLITEVTPKGSTSSSENKSIKGCEVTLLSGSSFTCNLPQRQLLDVDVDSASDHTPHSDAHSLSDDCQSIPRIRDEDEDGFVWVQLEPCRKRQKLEQQQQQQEEKEADEGPHQRDIDPVGPPWTVGELAELLLTELPKHAQMDPSPKTVFMVFAKNHPNDEAV